MFDDAHLRSPEILPLVDAAKFYYVGGFFLTHGVKSALAIAEKAANAGKVRSFSHLQFRSLLESARSVRSPGHTPLALERQERSFLKP